MSIYKEVTRGRVRFQTSKGELSVEQLWDLSVADLDKLAVSLQEEYKESGKKSFIYKKTPKDKISKLKFDVVLDVLETKMEELESARNKKQIQDHNSKIANLIAEKQEEELKSLSVSELKRLIK